jgi:hypothetical protein
MALVRQFLLFLAGVAAIVTTFLLVSDVGRLNPYGCNCGPADPFRLADMGGELLEARRIAPPALAGRLRFTRRAGTRRSRR